MKATIRLTLTTFQEIEVDVTELVREYGSKARSKSFLEDYAIGNRTEGVIINREFEVEIEKEVTKKVRKGIGSY